MGLMFVHDVGFVEYVTVAYGAPAPRLAIRTRVAAAQLAVRSPTFIVLIQPGGRQPHQHSP